MAEINIQKKINSYLASHSEMKGKSEAVILSAMQKEGIVTQAEIDSAKKTSAFGFGFNETEDMGLAVESTRPVENNTELEPVELQQLPKELDKTQAKDQCFAVLTESIQKAQMCLDNLNYGVINQLYDEYKENNGSEYTTFKLKQEIYDEECSLYFLQHSNIGNLTKKEYYEKNKERLRDMLVNHVKNFGSTGELAIDAKYHQGNDLSKVVEEYIQQKIDSITSFEHIKGMQVELLGMDEKQSVELANKMINESLEWKYQEEFKDQVPLRSLKCIPEEFNTTEKISFEEVYKLECGQEFSPKMIENYMVSQAKMQIVENQNNKLYGLSQIIAGINAYDDIEETGEKVADTLEFALNPALGYANNQIKRNKHLPEKLNNFSELLTNYYTMNPMLAKKEIGQLISENELPMTVMVDEDGNVRVGVENPDELENSNHLSKLMEKFEEQQKAKFDKFVESMGGMERLTYAYKDSYDNILGYHRAENMSKILESDDLTSTLVNICGGATTVGMIMSVGGAVLCFVPGMQGVGAALVSIGGKLAIGGMVAQSAIGYTEALTRGVQDSDELTRLNKEAAMNIGGFIIGAGAGKLATKTFCKMVSKELSTAFSEQINKGKPGEALKVIFKNPEYLGQVAKATGAKLGTDFVISYAGDLAMMGILDTEDTWETLLRANLIGVVVGSSNEVSAVTTKNFGNTLKIKQTGAENNGVATRQAEVRPDVPKADTEVKSEEVKTEVKTKTSPVTEEKSLRLEEDIMSDRAKPDAEFKPDEVETSTKPLPEEIHNLILRDKYHYYNTKENIDKLASMLNTPEDIAIASKLLSIQGSEHRVRRFITDTFNISRQKFGVNDVIKVLKSPKARTKVLNAIENGKYIKKTELEPLLDGENFDAFVKQNLSDEFDLSYKTQDITIENEIDICGKYKYDVKIKEQIDSLVPEGEVACINGSMYCRADNELIPINLSKELFDRLFPVEERYNIKQGNFGNCYFLGELCGYITTPNGRAALYSAFRQEGNDIYVKVPGYDNIEVKFKNGKLNELYPISIYKYSGNLKIGTGADHVNASYGIKMLEQAYAFMPHNSTETKTQIVANNKFMMNQQMHRIEGLAGSGLGTMHRMFTNCEDLASYEEGAFGNNGVSTIEEGLNILAEAKGKNSNIFGSVSFSEEFYINDLDLLYSNHVYSILGYDRETQIVKLVNPHDGSQYIKLPLEIFKSANPNFTVWKVENPVIKTEATKIKPKVENIHTQDKGVLEGGIKAEELTEVTPFARHLMPHYTADPIAILGENMQARFGINNFDLTSVEQTGLKLKYSRNEFAERIHNLVNNLPIEEQKSILKKFNIELIYTGDKFEISDMPKISWQYNSKNKLEAEIKSEIDRFTKENEFEIDNAEVKTFLDSFIKIAPEFLYIVGKKQHNAHAYTVDVHTIKVLQNAIESPDYQKLSSEDKLVINMSILLHDIGKKYISENEADNYHSDSGADITQKILKRFNLPYEVQSRITKLVSQHEFFKRLNNAYMNFKNAEDRANWEIEHGWRIPDSYNEYKSYLQREAKYVAEFLRNKHDFDLAKIITIADLKSINPDKEYTIDIHRGNKSTPKDEKCVGFEHMITNTINDEEFYSYMKEAFSHVDKEYDKYPEGIIETEPVTPEEAIQRINEIFGKNSNYGHFFMQRHFQSSRTIGRNYFDFLTSNYKRLLDAGVKKDDVFNKLKSLLVTNNDQVHYELSREMIDLYIENKDFIETHQYDISGEMLNLRGANAVNNIREKIRVIREREEISKMLEKKYGRKNELGIERLPDFLMIEQIDYQNDAKKYVLSHEALASMEYLLQNTKYSILQIEDIIHNSYTNNNHRFDQVYNGCRTNVEFNKQKFETIVELAKYEPLESAVADAKFCFQSKTPESGWVLEPKIVDIVKELIQLGIQDKSVLPELIDIEYDKGNQYTPGNSIINVSKNEAAFQRAIRYSKQGFDGEYLKYLVAKHERGENGIYYSVDVTDKLATLFKRGLHIADTDSDWIHRYLFDGCDRDGYDYKFNNETYEFVTRMLDKGISIDGLNSILYQSASYARAAVENVPEKVIERGRFSKAKVEALVDFFLDTGIDTIPKFEVDKIAFAFIDVAELRPEELDKMPFGEKSKSSPYIAPFLYRNPTKYQQAVEYAKKGVNVSSISYLTKSPELFSELIKEPDLSYIQTPEDADLVSAFWYLRGIKSINELSKQERILFTTELMMHKSEFENNNVSERIPILPKDSQGYSDMMKNIANSFGLNNEAYPQQKVSQINKNFSDISARLQVIKPSEIETDSAVTQIINEITSLVPNLNIRSVLLTLQRIVKTPEYSAFSESDKKLMNIAVILSKADSTTNNPFDSAIDACVFAKQMGLSDTDAMKIFAIVKNSNLTETLMNTKRNVRTNNDRSYISIVTDDIKETFETAAMELKDYSNFQMAKLLYTANEDFVSPEMLQVYAPDIYQEFLDIRNSVQLEKGEVSKDAKAMQIMQNNPKYTDKLEEVKLKGRDKYSLSRNLNKLLEEEIDLIKSSDVLLPQTNLSNFVKKQSPQWIQEHTRLVNGRTVLVVGSDEIPDFYMLSHTTQAYNILGKADATTNMSNFENFAMLFNNKTICLSYSGNGKIAVVGDVGLLIETPNTAQYIARGTDISSVAKDIPTMVSEYISQRSKIVARDEDFQTKATKEYDRNFFASLIKEELSSGYRMLLDQKISLEEKIREYDPEKTNESLENLQQQLRDIINQMRPIDKIYRTRIENLINKANGEVIDLEFIRANDPELGVIYDKILNTINVEHRGDDGIMRTEYHNEVLGSNTKPVGLFVRGDKELFNLTDDYLKKAEEEALPIVIYK